MKIAIYTREDALPDFCKSREKDIAFTKNPGLAETGNNDLILVFGKEQFHKNNEGHFPKKSPLLIFDELNRIDAYGFPAGSVIGRTVSWPCLLAADTWEICINDDNHKDRWHNLAQKLNKKIRLVKDVTGLVTPRILAGIINEAYYTLGDGISTKEEIDTAMKLGTNYPKGPFEWGKEIGLNNVYLLLKKLSAEDTIYAPAPAMEKEILQPD